MKIEEARKHIGKEVVLDESTKPYRLIICNELHEKAESTIKEGHRTIISAAYEAGDVKIVIFDSQGNKVDYWYINPIHLKLKQPNYKIRVTPKTSTELQKLFFELGYKWHTGNRIHLGQDWIYAVGDTMELKGMFYINSGKNYFQEITLPELRKLVFEKNSDPKDATHEDNYGRFWMIGDDAQYLWDLDSKTWKETQPLNLKFKELKKLENISIEVVAADIEYQFEKEIERHEVEPYTQTIGRTKMLEKNNGRTIEHKQDGSVVISKMNDVEYNELISFIDQLPAPSVALEAREYTEAELLLIIEELRK